MALTAIARSLQGKRCGQLSVSPVDARVFPYERYEAQITSIGAGCLGFRGEARIADEELQCQPSDACVTKSQILALNISKGVIHSESLTLKRSGREVTGLNREAPRLTNCLVKQIAPKSGFDSFGETCAR